MAEPSFNPRDLSLRSVLLYDTDAHMNLVENRVASFEHWPLNGEAICTPARMAEAGFYHCPTVNEPDLARCYVCLKQMAQWRPTDEPLEEHARSTECAFMRLGKKPQDLTTLEFLELERERVKNKVRERVLALREDLEAGLCEVKSALENVRNKR